jgi:hypothetical protein
VRLATSAKIGLGASAALVALTVAQPAVAWAGGGSGGGIVPCTGQAALVAAINAANTAGGTINLSPRCDYALTAPNNGANGLPVIVSQIRVNGHGATIDGTNTVRVFEVDGPGGNLMLNNVTITRGSAPDFGGGIESLGGTVTLNHSRVEGNGAVVAGGGIGSATTPAGVARLTLNDSSVTDNTQTRPTTRTIPRRGVSAVGASSTCSARPPSTGARSTTTPLTAWLGVVSPTAIT